jgi:hypothetical protein
VDTELPLRFFATETGPAAVKFFGFFSFVASCSGTEAGIVY